MALRGRPEPDLSVCSRRRRLLRRYPAAEIRSNPDFHKAGFAGTQNQDGWHRRRKKLLSLFSGNLCRKIETRAFLFWRTPCSPAAHASSSPFRKKEHNMENQNLTPTPKSNRNAKRSSSPASNRPAAHSPWATTWARSKTGARCRTSTTAPTASSTSTPSLSARTRRSSRPTPSRPTR